MEHGLAPPILDESPMGGFDMSPATLFAGLVVSKVGFVLFRYGKSEAEFPQILGGLALMACPMFVPGAIANYLVCASLLGGLWAYARFMP